MTIFYLLVECVGLYPFKDLDTSLPMLTARQVLTLPVIEKWVCWNSPEIHSGKITVSGCQLLLSTLLIAVIGSCSSAAIQVRQVLCGDQGTALDLQLWQSDPQWLFTWEHTQAFHGSVPELWENPGFWRPSRVLYMQVSEWASEWVSEWMKKLKTNVETWVLKSGLPMNALWQWTVAPGSSEVIRHGDLTCYWSSYLAFFCPHLKGCVLDGSVWLSFSPTPPPISVQYFLGKIIKSEFHFFNSLLKSINSSGTEAIAQ